jgi:hypothetical protein
MEDHNTNREERILNSLDGLQKAGAPDFFYTRLIGRMQNEMLPVKRPVFLLRPAFITAVLLVVFIVNIVSLTQFNKEKTAASSSQPATIESFAKAYNMETGSVYE